MSGNSSTDIWIAGAFAAFSVDLLVYPLDTLKTRIQSPDYRRLYVDASTDAVRRGALFRGLYQGITSVVLATLPSSGAFFTTYENTKYLLAHPHLTTYLALPTPIVHSAASAIAECVSCAILTPAEVIKQNAQMVDGAAGGANATVQTLRKFRRKPLALWRGYTVLTSRNLPFTAMQFPLFERFKTALSESREQRNVQRGRGGEKMTLLERGTITATAAGSAGAISAVLTTPIDVVKTRVMLTAAQGFASQEGPASKAAESLKQGKVVDALGAVRDGSPQTAKPQKQSSMEIARTVIREQGWKGLWRGGALRGVWTMLGSGLYLGVYESGRLYLEGRRDARREADDE